MVYLLCVAKVAPLKDLLDSSGENEELCLFVRSFCFLLCEFHEKRVFPLVDDCCTSANDWRVMVASTVAVIVILSHWPIV